MPGWVFDYVGGCYDGLCEELYDARCLKTVVLDQCIGVMSLAQSLTEKDVLVIRAYNSGSIADDEIIRVADRAGALVLTRDKKKPFKFHPRTLTIKSDMVFNETNIGTLANDVWYVLGLINNPGTHLNGNGSREYLCRLETLKRCFSSTGDYRNFSYIPVLPKPRNGYTHNNPAYVDSLRQKCARLQNNIDTVLKRPDAAESDAITRMREITEELQKQITELEKFSLPESIS